LSAAINLTVEVRRDYAWLAKPVNDNDFTLLHKRTPMAFQLAMREVGGVLERLDKDAFGGLANAIASARRIALHGLGREVSR
jgi:hypothetical protein